MQIYKCHLILQKSVFEYLHLLPKSTHRQAIIFIDWFRLSRCAESIQDYDDLEENSSWQRLKIKLPKIKNHGGLLQLQIRVVKRRAILSMFIV